MLNKKFKRLLSLILSVVMIFSAVTFISVSAGAAELEIIGNGWFETAYAEWKPVSGAGYYEAFVKKSSEASYTKLDDELVRQYDTYVRADALGLPAGSYDLKVTAYSAQGGNVVAEKEVKNIDVKPYDRTGSVFSSQARYASEGVGAYNNDGSLKSNAKVIYVTAETAKTVSTDIIYDSKGGTQTFTGLQQIVYGYQKGYDKTPLAIRIIGTINDTDMDELMSNEGLQVKGKNSYAQLNITIEGVGNDAAIKNFGILVRNAGSCEFRNFGIILCMDDCLSLDTDNSDIWIHNMDFFYGKAGGDSDQAKGDGTVDVKGDSQFVTISYNHFYDSGKSSLCGLNESSPNYITYHHNWFDHSDSRHPRVRVMSVHIYNNYYDGNAKYGAASADSASIFAESNYFRSCKYPFLIGGQGHEAGEVLSGEVGAPIKSYNNIMVGAYKYTDYADDNSSYDGYMVAARDEQIPSTVTAAGGTYNNFDTSVDLGVTADQIDDPADVPGIVMAEAGRCNSGDFFYTIYDDYDTDYNVDTDHKNNLIAYETSLRQVGGTRDASKVNESAAPSSATGIDGNTAYQTREAANTADAASLPTESEAPSEGGGSSQYKLKLDGKSLGGSTLSTELTGLGTDGAFTIKADGTKTVILSSSKGIQLGGAGSTASRCITVTVPEGVDDAVIYVSCASTGSDTRYIAVSDGTKVLNYNTDGTTTTISTEGGSYGPVGTGTYYIYSTNKGINVSMVGVSWGGDDPIGPDPVPDETTEEDSSESSTDEESTESSTVESSTDEESVESTTEVKGDDVAIDNVEFETTLNSDTNKNPDKGEISYTDNGDGTYSILDQNTNRTGKLNFSFAEQKENTVVISGTFKPSVSSNNWTLLQVQGSKPSTTETGVMAAGEVFGIRTANGVYNLRVAAGSTLIPTTAAVGANAEASYVFTINYTNKTVNLTVNGASTGDVSFADSGIESVDGVCFVTATGVRDITMSAPKVTVTGNGEEPSSESSSETESESSSETESESSSETESEPDTDEPVDGLVGDVDNNGIITANDAAALLTYILDNGAKKDNWKTELEIADVNADNDITAADAAEILKKVLNSAHKFSR